MRKYTLAAVFLLLVASPVLADYYVCTTIYDLFPDPTGNGGLILLPVSISCVYVTTVSPLPIPPPPPPGGGGGPEPPPPPNPTPPNPPIVWFDSISDGSPNQPTLAVYYNDSVVGLTLDIAGRPPTGLAPPQRTFFLPSLNNMTAAQTELRVTAYDLAGNTATATAHVRRSSQTVRASNEFLLQYWYQIPGTREFDYRIAHYNRGVATDITYADYDIVTSGDRNGRVQHIWAEDGLFWSNSNLQLGASPTPYPSIFEQKYVIVPSYLMQAADYAGTECTPSGRTRLMFPAFSYPGDAGRCDQLAEFSAARSPLGTFTIVNLDAGNVPFYYFLQPIIIGDRSLTVQP